MIWIKRNLDEAIRQLENPVAYNGDPSVEDKFYRGVAEAKVEHALWHLKQLREEIENDGK